MINFLVITHGDFGSYAVEAAETIVGEQKKGVCSVAITPRMTLPEARARVDRAVRELLSPDGLIILTDIPGGTPANICIPLVKDKPRVAVLSGLNLYMLITGFSNRDLPFEDLTQKMLKNSANSIVDLHKLFLSRTGP